VLIGIESKGGLKTGGRDRHSDSGDIQRSVRFIRNFLNGMDLT
jgi:hypothetical protein